MVVCVCDLDGAWLDGWDGKGGGLTGLDWTGLATVYASYVTLLNVGYVCSFIFVFAVGLCWCLIGMLCCECLMFDFWVLLMSLRGSFW